MTVFDPSAVIRLEADTQSRTFVRTMLGTYLTMLTPRVDRIIGAVDAADSDEAMDATLSLRVSSVMTGATELAELAGVLSDELRNDDLALARAQAVLLPEAAERARDALNRHLRDSLVPAQESTDSIR